jgi:hypothetical protein
VLSPNATDPHVAPSDLLAPLLNTREKKKNEGG